MHRSPSAPTTAGSGARCATPAVFGLLVSLVLTMPLVLGACCGPDKVDNSANLAARPAGTAAIDSPMQCWAYLVEALSPEFEPPADAPEGEKLPAGRPNRVWYLLAHEVRDELGPYDKWMANWSALRRRMLTVFVASRAPSEDGNGNDNSNSGGTEGGNAAPTVGTIRTLHVPAAGDQPAVDLQFVFEYDKTRFPGEPGAIWRLKAAGIDTMLLGEK